jgi:hypothetical protein
MDNTHTTCPHPHRHPRRPAAASMMTIMTTPTTRPFLSSKPTTTTPPAKTENVHTTEPEPKQARQREDCRVPYFCQPTAKERLVVVYYPERRTQYLARCRETARAQYPAATIIQPCTCSLLSIISSLAKNRRMIWNRTSFLARFKATLASCSDAENGGRSCGSCSCRRTRRAVRQFVPLWPPSRSRQHGRERRRCCR